MAEPEKTFAQPDALVRELVAVVTALKEILDDGMGRIGRDTTAIRESVHSLANRVGHLERRVDALERHGTEPPAPANKRERIERALDELRAAVADVEMMPEETKHA